MNPLEAIDRLPCNLDPEKSAADDQKLRQVVSSRQVVLQLRFSLTTEYHVSNPECIADRLASFEESRSQFGP